MHASVSVVIPCFRCADTIDRAVESVYQQTLRPFELILVEDCSGDRTLEKLYELQTRYPKGWVKVIGLEQNEGPGTARNEGWKISEQDYVAFLDADDSWHPKKIELQYLWMKNNPLSVITGHKCQVVNETERRVLIAKEPSVFRAERISPEFLMLKNKFQTPGVMVKRGVPFRMLGGKRYSEDYHLWLKIIFSGGEGYFFDCTLAFLHKAEYGAGGLSGNLWKLEKGELDTYFRIHGDGHIGILKFFLVSGFSLAKYIRRVLLVFFRGIGRV